MKPTLFVEDLPTHGRTQGEEALARVLPRRCPNCAHPDMQHDTGSCSCKSLDYGCDGAGFLYPDPPDDWPDLTGYRVSSKWPHIPWETYCDVTWQMVLGIVDTE